MTYLSCCAFHKQLTALCSINCRHAGLFIININSDNLKGQHCKAVYGSKNKEREVFDSLATTFELLFDRWINPFTRKWTASRLITLQNPLSASCGGYTLYFVMFRFNGDL